MTSIQITRFGGPEVLRAVDSPPQPLTPDGVRIAVKASGVCFADVQMRMGLYPEAPRPPFVPGYEVAGVVRETGPAARSFHPGDRVLAVSIFGGYATEIVLPETQVRATPAHLSDAEAAAIPVSFLTAWFALVDMARVRLGRQGPHSRSGRRSGNGGGSDRRPRGGERCGSRGLPREAGDRALTRRARGLHLRGVGAPGRRPASST